MGMVSSGAPLKLPKVGSTIGGKYAIDRVLGRGGMAVVFEARHLKLRQTVALKMLLPAVCDMPDTVKRFEREARAAVQLHGPNVARVLDVDATADGIPFIVMEFLEGHDLAEEMTKRGQMPVVEAVDFVLQACAAMYEAHARGIIHRDLKPSNLFVCSRGNGRILKVLDFGIVKLESADSTVTRAEVVLGTPAYMSPEQIRSAMTVDARTDIWSLGVILYELLASELPFEGSTAPSMSNAILSDAPKPLKPRRPDAPDELVDAVMRALAKSAAERWPDVRAFADAVAPFGPPPGVFTPPELSTWSAPAPRSVRVEGAPDERGEDVPLEGDGPAHRRPSGAGRVRRSDDPAPARASGRFDEETVDAERADAALDLSRTAAAPRITPAVGAGAFAVLIGVSVLAFMMGRSGGAGWQVASAPPTASALASASASASASTVAPPKASEPPGAPDAAPSARAADAAAWPR